jgi:mercuric ion binding protein
MNFLRAPLGLLTPVIGALAVLVFSVLAVSAQEVARPTYTIQVDGMACPFCAYGVEKSLAGIPGVEGIETDIDTGILTVTMAAEATLHAMAATRAVEDAGFVLNDFREIQVVGRTLPTE